VASTAYSLPKVISVLAEAERDFAASHRGSKCGAGQLETQARCGWYVDADKQIEEARRNAAGRTEFQGIIVWRLTPRTPRSPL